MLDACTRLGFQRMSQFMSIICKTAALTRARNASSRCRSGRFSARRFRFICRQITVSAVNPVHTSVFSSCHLSSCHLQRTDVGLSGAAPWRAAATVPSSAHPNPARPARSRRVHQGPVRSAIHFTVRVLCVFSNVFVVYVCVRDVQKYRSEMRGLAEECRCLWPPGLISAVAFLTHGTVTQRCAQCSIQ